MKHLSSVILAGAAALALAAAPALAQTMAAPSGGGAKSDMSMPSKAPAKKAMKRPAKHMAMAGKTKLTCMDYAYQSQSAKDCEAGKIKPPNWR